MIRILNKDNMKFDLKEEIGFSWCEAIFADCIYESLDFSWTNKYWEMLKDNGIFFIMTDFHTVSEIDVHMKNVVGANRINMLVWRNEWGHPPSKKFHECYDYILIYCKGNKWRFNGERIQVPKATAKSKGLNPSGRTTKNATAWIDDITLTTVAKERIKHKDGTLVRWQKPVALIKRLLSPFLLEGDLIVDPFAGVASAGVACSELNMNYIGLEYDKKIFKLAQKRMKPFLNEQDYIPF